LRAFLFDRNSTYKSIANYFKLSPEVVRLFADLFFNIYDRLDDPEFISHQLASGSRVTSHTGDACPAEDAGWIMRRLAYEFGWRVAAQYVGIEPLDDPSLSLDQQTQNFERLGLANGLLFARAGGLNWEGLPGIQHAKSLVLARRKASMNSPEIVELDPLSMLSVDQGIMKTLHGIIGEDAAELLRNRREGAAAESGGHTHAEE
jgi:hypothetical protein